MNLYFSQKYCTISEQIYREYGVLNAVLTLQNPTPFHLNTRGPLPVVSEN